MNKTCNYTEPAKHKQKDHVVYDTEKFIYNEYWLNHKGFIKAINIALGAETLYSLFIKYFVWIFQL